MWRGIEETENRYEVIYDKGVENISYQHSSATCHSARKTMDILKSEIHKIEFHYLDFFL